MIIEGGLPLWYFVVPAAADATAAFVLANAIQERNPALRACQVLVFVVGAIIALAMVLWGMTVLQRQTGARGPSWAGVQVVLPRFRPVCGAWLKPRG